MESLETSLAPYRDRRLLLGLSGGADSVAMLRALLRVGAVVAAAHLDHGLRASSADDARWVTELCASLNVPCEVRRVDVRAVAEKRRESLEVAARRVRYDFLARSAKAAGADVVLTAHHRGDQAETVLHEVLRGEHATLGISRRAGRVERPWLHVSRAEIRAYLAALGQPWREDDSNRDVTFTRNWLRHEILPSLTERFPNVEVALARRADWDAEDERVLSDLAAALPEDADFSREPLGVLRRFVASRLRASRLTFHAAHVDRLAHALQGKGTTHLTLPGRRDVTVTNGRLHAAPRTWPMPAFDPPPEAVLRHRRPGDRIRLPGGTRKVSDVLTDAKVPRGERDVVWLLAVESDVLWLGLDPPVTSVALGASPRPWDGEMSEALRAAREAFEAGEVPIGAVVVRGEIIVASAANTSRRSGDMTRHAELEVLREASHVLGTPYLTDCTLVVTLEPCPMCFGAIVEARVGRVVYGADNVKMGALGGVRDLSRANFGHRFEVVRGVRARECGRLLEAFFEQRRP
ncbi:tRNA lysidine(34) synthetase TilS [Deinococcus yavapaiensis]|uniref:Multifunctional fusion protein n=1 Tax=Deinococcus yavapaiensis KR-236 TaxID=694435 RepID=A0A318SQ21_9DEIO|nr:tRNA lysidine(34) synthetase TilS [Deinococcus yavapaiensis]PYE54933.1 tRNA(Ile)-lysidine synthase [Deinococcus yavapaiensis KR-236]